MVSVFRYQVIEPMSERTKSAFPWRISVALIAIGVAALFPWLSQAIKMACPGPLCIQHQLGRWYDPPTLPGHTDTSTWKEGTEQDVYLTLIGADSYLLSCADPQNIDGVHCGFEGPGRRWPREGPLSDVNRSSVIQPYRTAPDNKLILVAGIWATPELAMRLHQEPPRELRKAKLSRFVARCRVSFLGGMKKPELRWGPKDAFAAPVAEDYYDNRDVIPVARALSCNILEGGA